MNDADGKPTQDRGKYLKAFEKQADGKTPPESRTWSDTEKEFEAINPERNSASFLAFWCQINLPRASTLT